jgi:hypothetical protein
VFLPGGVIAIILRWLWGHFSFGTTLKLAIWFSGVAAGVIAYLMGQFSISTYDSVIVGMVIGVIATILLYMSRRIR